MDYSTDPVSGCRFTLLLLIRISSYGHNNKETRGGEQGTGTGRDPGDSLTTYTGDTAGYMGGVISPDLLPDLQDRICKTVAVHNGVGQTEVAVPEHCTKNRLRLLRLCEWPDALLEGDSVKNGKTLVPYQACHECKVH